MEIRLSPVFHGVLEPLAADRDRQAECLTPGGINPVKGLIQHIRILPYKIIFMGPIQHILSKGILLIPIKEIYPSYKKKKKKKEQEISMF